MCSAVLQEARSSQACCGGMRFCNEVQCLETHFAPISRVVRSACFCACLDACCLSCRHPSRAWYRFLQLRLPAPLKAFLEAQNSVMAHSLSNSTAHFDAHSDSLKQLSFRSPAWAMAAPELSVCDGGSGSSIAIGAAAGGREATFKTPGGIGDQRQKHVGPGSQAKHWGLWHEGEEMDGEWDDTGGGSADDTESAEEMPGAEVQQDGRCAVTCSHQLRVSAQGSSKNHTTAG